LIDLTRAQFDPVSHHETRAVKIHLRRPRELFRGSFFEFSSAVFCLAWVADSLFARFAYGDRYKVAEKNAIPKGILPETVQFFWLRGFIAGECP
jgi:hypothetical protein